MRMKTSTDLFSPAGRTLTTYLRKPPRTKPRQGMGRIAASATALTLSAVVSYTCNAAPRESSQTSLLHFSTSTFDSAQLEGAAGASASVRETQLDAMLPLRAVPPLNAYTWTMSLMHRYRAITFNALTPRADFNGDVHVVGLGLHAGREAAGYRRALTLRPVIAVSSNALKNPDALTSKALAMQFAWTEYRTQTTTINWLFGIGSDDRLGKYAAYPIAGVTWAPDSSTRLELAYPHTRFIQQVTAQITLSVSLSPDGGEWHVYNKSMENQSDFQWENWRTALTLSWSHPSGGVIELEGGWLFQQHMRIPLENAAVLATDVEDSAFASVAAGWHWR